VVTRIVLTNIAVSFSVLHSRCTQEQLDLTENASILVLTNIVVFFVVLHNKYIVQNQACRSGQSAESQCSGGDGKWPPPGTSTERTE